MCVEGSAGGWGWAAGSVTSAQSVLEAWRDDPEGFELPECLSIQQLASMEAILTVSGNPRVIFFLRESCHESIHATWCLQLAAWVRWQRIHDEDALQDWHA